MTLNFDLHAHAAAPPAVQPSGSEVSSGPPSSLVADARLTQVHCELICSLASMLLRYGQAEDARGLLDLNRLFWPRDEKTLRLLAKTLTMSGQWQAADDLLRELDQIRPGGRVGPACLLQRAVIAMRLGRVAEAAQRFRSFISLRPSASAHVKTGEGIAS